MPLTKLSFIIAGLLSVYLAAGSAAQFVDRLEGHRGEATR